ncbi:MAG: hypothetical protein GWP59_01870 [Chlamydiales bacterium]|nr:alpha-1,2-fucosyltransferase [Chlamydiales bacterium]NCF70426.1 hypothetical protein [Chlamydiales bacterium]
MKIEDKELASLATIPSQDEITQLGLLNGRSVKPSNSMLSNGRFLTLVFTPGRLGNQLYELATAICYAKEHNKKIFIPRKFTDNPSHYNAFEILKKDSRYFTSVKKRPKSDLVYKEKRYAYTPLPSSKGNISIKGYFQSWKYFHKIRPLLLSLISFNSEIRKRMESKYASALSGNTVAVHVRRGDYSKYGFKILNDKNYYKKALERFPKDAHLMVFSDDLEEAKKLKSLKKFSHITWIDEGQFESLYLMTRCKNHVIANSSYSWWGAYLSANGSSKPKGQVLAPLTWFTKSDFFINVPDDQFLKHWERV